MKPRVLFFVLPYVVKNIDANRSKIRSFLAFPYGLLSVATYNKDLADIMIVDLNVDFTYPKTICDALEEFRPDIVGFTMMFDNSYLWLDMILHTVNEWNPEILTILGGAAASYSYEEILQENPSLDAICYSEGEIPMRWLLMAWKHAVWEFGDSMFESSPSWITRKSLERGSVPKISFVEDLDQVIDIDYSLVDPSIYDMQEAFSPFIDHRKKHNQYFVVTGRGCPFKCTFCSNSKIHGKKMRFASIERISDHVRYLVDNYWMDVLTIYDDQLLINRGRAKALFRELAKYRLRIEMPNGLSPAFIDDEMADLMRSAGVDTVYLAIEHGNEWVLRDLIKKPLRLEQVQPAVDALQENNIFVHGFFVIGMPGEQHEHRVETVERIKEWGLDWAGLNPATPVRGSALYDLCIERKWITKQRISDIEDKKYIINAPEIGLTPEIIEAELNWMNLDVNFINNRRMLIGDYKTAAECFREVLRRYPKHQEAGIRLVMCEERMKMNGSN